MYVLVSYYIIPYMYMLFYKRNRKYLEIENIFHVSIQL